MINKSVVYSLLLFSFTAVAAEQFYYSYIDSNGRTYIEDSVSANHAKYGYRVVNSQGMTIRTVPGTAELEAKEEKRRKQTSIIDVKKSENDGDQYLLRSFVDVEDIRNAGNNKIMAIQTQIDTTINQIKAFEENLAQLEQQIYRADLEKREIGQEEVDSIRQIKDSIAQNKLFVQRRIEQQEKIRDEYLEYIKRFQQLKSKE